MMNCKPQSKPSNSEPLDSLEPLDPNDEPPQDRFCDVVLDGGVINGVVYPGFLLELARKFHFRSIGGTSVGAIAGALAAACEFNRRYQGNNGFNEGLAKMPAELASWVDEPTQMTKIRSLFQPDPKVKRLFDWFVDVLGTRMKRIDKQAEERQKREAESNSIIKTDEIPVLPMQLRNWVMTVLEKLLKSLKDNSTQPTNWVMMALGKAIRYFGPDFLSILFWVLVTLDFGLFVFLVMQIDLAWIFVFGGIFFLFCVMVLHPFLIFIEQICALIKLPSAGICTGMKVSQTDGDGLFEWLHEGIQKAANLPLHQPLTFLDLWQAPCGPKAADGGQEPKSIDLRMITTCLSHGRIYELPFSDDNAVLMFRLSEFKPYFPESIIAHLRRVSQPMNVDTCGVLQKNFQKRNQDLRSVPDFVDTNLAYKEFIPKWEKCKKEIQAKFEEKEDEKNGLNESDIREFPWTDLPIVVAARMSMSVPILFQNIPLIGFKLDGRTEDIKLVRLWFADGGIGSNFPIHLFDKAIPRWPTFGLKILDEPPRNDSQNKPLVANMPYAHKDGADDTLLYPKDDSEFSAINKKSSTSSIGSFIKMLFSVYTSAKDGHDQSFLRMPDVRNRVVRIYMNHRAGNMLNLKIEPDKIIQLARDVGTYGGQIAANAYLAEVSISKYSWVNSWQDHRWVRFNMLTTGLRKYLSGFSHVSQLEGLPGTANCNTLRDQVLQATQKPPLRSRSQPSDEMILTQLQSEQLLKIIDAISELETQLKALDMPQQPYVPEPMPVLRFKPTY